MWIRSSESGLVALVTNPYDVPDDCNGAWKSGDIYFRYVSINNGFRLPSEWQELESSNCFKKKSRWCGLKVRWVPYMNEFVTI